jgi:hypothetical protein
MRILFTPKNGKNSCGKKFLKKNLMARGFSYRAWPSLETIGAKKINVLTGSKLLSIFGSSSKLN